MGNGLGTEFLRWARAAAYNRQHGLECVYKKAKQTQQTHFISQDILSMKTPVVLLIVGLLAALQVVAFPHQERISISYQSYDHHHCGNDYDGHPHHGDVDNYQLPDSFVTFERFLDQVAHATYEQYKHTGVNEDNFEIMKTLIEQVYGGVTKAKVTSFLQDGRHVDCIAIGEQHTVRKLGIKEIAVPPKITTFGQKAEPIPGRFNADSPLKLGLVDDFKNVISCPTHTIPMLRMTLEKLTNFSSVDDTSLKVSRARPWPESEFLLNNDHRYAYAQQSMGNFGGNSWLNLWSPVGDFSLSQQWYTATAEEILQTVEGGWMVYPQMFGTTKAVLFIYSTNHNYAHESGCYNLECAAFVQTSNKWLLGGTWTGYSTTHGTQWGFEMQWKLYSGNWWLFLRGAEDYEPVGYYPTSIFRGGAMSKNASWAKYGGETIPQKEQKEGKLWPPMGSGAFPSEQGNEAAFQNKIFYIPHDENGGIGVLAGLTPVSRSPACYWAKVENATSEGSYLIFGGPGGYNCQGK